MAYQLSTTAKARLAQAGPDYAIKILNLNEYTYHGVCFKLEGPGGVKGVKFYFHVPARTPLHRVRSVRDTLRAAIEQGRITSRDDWNSLTAQVRRAVKALNKAEA